MGYSKKYFRASCDGCFSKAKCGDKGWLAPGWTRSGKFYYCPTCTKARREKTDES